MTCSAAMNLKSNAFIKLWTTLPLPQPGPPEIRINNIGKKKPSNDNMSLVSRVGAVEAVDVVIAVLSAGFSIAQYYNIFNSINSISFAEYNRLIQCKMKIYVFHTRGGGVHDLQMDGGLPLGFQKGTLF